MSKFKLEELEKHLKEQDYSCLLETPSDEFPFPRLLIELMNDEKERERIMEIRIRDQLVTPTYYQIEYITKLPFDVLDHAILDTARFTCFLNRSIDLTGFEFDEVQSELYFRHTLLGNKNKTDIRILHANLGAIILLLDLLSPNLEQVATGKATMNEIIEASLAELEKIGTLLKEELEE